MNVFWYKYVSWKIRISKVSKRGDGIMEGV